MSPDTTHLLINADDFGLSPGINRAIGELHAAGVLPSATLMACGWAFDHALAVAASHPSLDVGCHVVLVDGSPMAPRADVSTLLTSNEKFRASLPRFIFDLQRGHLRESDIEAEAIAQIRHLQRAGVVVTHVDTHKHTHLFPRVARPIMRAAAACGVHAIRNPFEPSWSIRLTRGAHLRRIQMTLLRQFQSAFHQLAEQFRIATTDGCIGVSATGTLDSPGLDAMLRALPSGIWELVCHPGYIDSALGAINTRLKHSREVERLALLNAVPSAGAALQTFRELATAISKVPRATVKQNNGH